MHIVLGLTFIAFGVLAFRAIGLWSLIAILFVMGAVNGYLGPWFALGIGALAFAGLLRRKGVTASGAPASASAGDVGSPTTAP